MDRKFGENSVVRKGRVAFQTKGGRRGKPKVFSLGQLQPGALGGFRSETIGGRKGGRIIFLSPKSSKEQVT